MEKKVVVLLLLMAVVAFGWNDIEAKFYELHNRYFTDKEYYSNRYLTTFYPNTYKNTTEIINEYGDLTYDFLELIKFSDYDNDDIHGGYQSIMAIDNKSGTFDYTNLELIEQFTPEEVLQIRFDGIKEMCEDKEDTWSNFKIHDSIKSIEIKGYRAAVGTFELVEYIPYMNVNIKRRLKRYVIFKERILVSVIMAPRMLKTYEEEIKEMEEILKDTSFNFSGR